MRGRGVESVFTHYFYIYAGNSQSTFLTVRLNDDPILYNTGERYI